jgi:polyhydroxybutyrate depolymerase
MRRGKVRIGSFGQFLWLWPIVTLVLTSIYPVVTLGDDTPLILSGPSGAATRYPSSINYGGQERRFVVHVPPCYDGVTPLPIVIALHGATGSCDSFLDETNWGDYANQFGFIALAPQGLPLHAYLPSASIANPSVWNTGEYGPIYSHSKIDDTGFILSALDNVAARWKLNLRRVYLVGYSNGGAMAFRLASEHAERFTALATVSGICWLSDPRPCRSLPTLSMVGTLDPLVSIHGGMKILPWEVRPAPSVRSVMSKWASAIGCPPTPQSAGQIPGHNVKIEDYGPSESGTLLRVMYIHGQGHAWPGGHSLRPERLLGPDISSFNATGAIWEFFQQWSW